MTLASKLTFSRLIMAPLFFAVYFLSKSAWTVPVLWAVFIVSEITDMLDGMAARKRNEVSDFGKLFDPFADTLMQITCFLCFVIDDIFPAFLFLLVIYREFGILFIRNLMLKKGVAMGARLSGKIKTITYIIAGGAALLTASLDRLAVPDFLYHSFQTGAAVVFMVSVILSVISFFDYLFIFQKTP